MSYTPRFYPTSIPSLGVVPAMITVACSVLAFSKLGWANDDSRVTGNITALSSSSITVATLTCSISGGVECENSLSAPVSCSSIKKGDRVRLTCRSGFAKNIALVNGGGSSSSSSSSSAGSSSSASSSSSSRSSSSKSSSRSSSRSSSASSSPEKRDRNLRALLSASTGVTTSAVASLRFQSSSKGKEQQLTSTVKLPLPSLFPVAPSADTAAQLQMTVSFFRDGTAYSSCTLRYSSSKSKNEGSQLAEFKLDVKRSEGKVRSKKGVCDTDLTTSGVQKGIPAVLKGDTVILEELTAGVFMEGSL